MPVNSFLGPAAISDKVVVFSAKTGALTPTGDSLKVAPPFAGLRTGHVERLKREALTPISDVLEVSQPACVAFLPFK